MRKLLLVLPLVMLSMSCSGFTWKGMGHGIDKDQEARGIKDVTQLTREYETERYWAQVRARRDGRVNAWARGFERVQDALDRHLFNYSPSDPYLNHPTDSNVLRETGKFTIGFLAR